MRALSLVLVASGVAMGSFSPASAEPMFRVTPQAAPADGKIIVHDMSWQCASGSCVAPRTGSSTDTTVCSALARGLGRLASFSVGDAAFDAAAMEQCNRRAR